MTGRAAVRRILARYVGEPAAALDFSYGEHGKPGLAAHPSVQFNLAHADGVGVLAVGPTELGIDIELGPTGGSDVRTDTAVAEQFFSRSEVAELALLPARDRDRGFLVCWTRKEAYLKATGGGLAFPLDRFAVSLNPAEPPRVIWSELDPAGAGWNVLDVSAMVTPYIVALVIPTERARPAPRSVSIITGDRASGPTSHRQPCITRQH